MFIFSYWAGSVPVLLIHYAISFSRLFSLFLTSPSPKFHSNFLSPFLFIHDYMRKAVFVIFLFVVDCKRFFLHIQSHMEKSKLQSH